jgi:polyhydroxyalkanoate synthesis regulator phasin
MAKKKKVDLGEEFKELTLEAFELFRKKLKKGVKKLIKESEVSLQKGKDFLDEQVKKWEKKSKERLLKELKELGVLTKEDWKEIKNEIEKLKKEK